VTHFLARPHLLIAHSVWVHQWINSLIRSEPSWSNDHWYNQYHWSPWSNQQHHWLRNKQPTQWLFRGKENTSYTTSVTFWWFSAS
jgi:hypothetical protein